MEMKTSVLSLQAVADKQTHITEEIIDVAALINQFHDDAAGAVVVFSGNVRNNSVGKAVDYLYYEAAESMAEKMMEDLLQESREKWPLVSAFAVHRIGKVKIGECAVVVLTASPHRKEAYDANRYLIEKIKHELPLWKCEYFADGTKEWGGNCSCQQVTGDPHLHVYDID